MSSFCGAIQGVEDPCLDPLRRVSSDAQARRDLIRSLEPDARHLFGQPVGVRSDRSDSCFPELLVNS